MEYEEELLDLVNENDEVIGTVLRAEYYAAPIQHEGYLRAVEIFIVDDQGRLWIPRRTMDKKIAPGGLDYSCGGHVSSGESYIESGLREIEEELNLHLHENDLHLVKKFHPVPGMKWFREIYKYQTNEVPAYNPNDFSEYEWLTPGELIAKLEAGEPAKSSLLYTIKEIADNLGRA